MADEQSLSDLTSITQQILDHLKAGQAEGGGGKTAEDKNKKKMDTDRRAAEGLVIASVKQVGQSFINFGSTMNDIAVAGRQLATTLGTSVTKGIDQEFKNRNTIFKQIFAADRDRMVSMEQLRSAEESLANTFMGAANGMEISAAGAAKFGAALKGGFNSDFKLTGDSMRALITAGVATEQGFESLRKASGRAGLSNTQLATLVNKNSLSFMLYGPKFAKAAQEAERLGINLAATQAAQESMVTNLDGTLDTLNQLNQLGANIDFGTLTKLNETGGPEATLKYLQSTIPPSMFQSASVRAMLRGFGIPLEDLMKKQGSAQDNAAKTMEEAMTQLQEPVSNISKILTELTQRGKALMDSYGPQIKAFGALVFSVISLTFAVKAFGGVIATVKAIAAAMSPAAAGNRIATLLGKTGGGGAGGSITPAVGGGGEGLGGAAKGTSAFSAGNVLKGAAAMLVVAAAVWVLAKGLQQFSTVQWADMGKAAVALGVLAAAAFGLSFIAPAIGIGALAIAGLGASLIPFGIALRIMAPALPTLSAFITSLGGLKLGTAVALGALGPALVSFAGGMVAASAASLVGGGIVNKIIALGSAGAGVVALSGAIKTLKTSLDELNTVDTSKLKDIKSFTNAATVNTAVGNVTAPFAAIAARIRGTPTAGAEPIAGTSELVRKVDELIKVLRDTKTVISIDNKIQQLPRTALAGVTVRNDRI